jgi:hypothetical protein
MAGREGHTGKYVLAPEQSSICTPKWEQVRNERIRNKQVRFCFCNIPKIESFINKRTATYVGKVARSSDDELPKKFLGAWMHQPRKTHYTDILLSLKDICYDIREQCNHYTQDLSFYITVTLSSELSSFDQATW